MDRQGTTDPDISEWVVPVRWIEARTREHAIKDSDFFANQNSAVRMTHGYTLKRLADAFGVAAVRSRQRCDEARAFLR